MGMEISHCIHPQALTSHLWDDLDEIQGAAVFLSSQAARFITGVVLPVDGGFLVGGI